MYSILKHSQVSFNHEEPYYVAQNSHNVEYKNRLEDSGKLLAREQDDFDVNQKYDQILNDAQCKADEIIRSAVEEGERLAKLREKEGFEEGRRLADKERDEEIDALRKFKIELHEDFEKKVSEFKNNILDLSLALSEKIIKTECAKDNDIILNMLENIVSKYRDENNLTVEVSKNIFDKLTSTGVKTDYNLRQNEEFKDTDIQISLANGVIDASIDVQFENLKQALVKESLCYGV